MALNVSAFYMDVSDLQATVTAVEWPAAVETPAAPEGATGVTDWLLPANDDLLPEY